MIKKVFVHCLLPEEEKRKLGKFFSVKFHNADKKILSTEELIKEASGYDALIVQGNLLEKAFIEKNKSFLKAISNVAVGFDNIDIKTASKYKIPVFNTPNVLDAAVADLAIGLLISVTRKICEGYSFVKKKKWKNNSWPLFWGEDFYKESLGIVGLGNIGKEISKRALGFGFKISYYNRNKLASKLEKKLNVNYLEFEDLLKLCKYIILTLPLNRESKYLFNKKAFNKMRKDSFLVNVARGKIVKEKDLVDALEDKKIMGAALDVFENEPKINNKLYKLKNVVLLPHMGSATKKTRNEMMKLACDNLINYVFKNNLENLVNKEIFSEEI